MMNPKLKESLISAAYTFVTMFVLTILITIQDLSWQSVSAGALGGVIVAAARAGIKAIIPLLQSLSGQSK